MTSIESIALARKPETVRRHSAQATSTALRLKGPHELRGCPEGSVPGSRSASAFLFARNELNALTEAAVQDVASEILQQELRGSGGSSLGWLRSLTYTHILCIYYVCTIYQPLSTFIYNSTC